MSRTPGKDGDGFLQRWSRRKINQRGREADGDPSAAPRPQPPQAVEAVSDGAAGESDAELLERLDLPAPEALGGDDDFATYLRAPLSAALRRRTLRHLWLVKPELANLDGLLEYGEDFNAPSEIGAMLGAASKVARGAREWSLGSAAEPLAPAGRAVEDGYDGAAGDSASAEPEVGQEGRDAVLAGENESAQAGDVVAENFTSLPRAHRMRFDFDSAKSG